MEIVGQILDPELATVLSDRELQKVEIEQALLTWVNICESPTLESSDQHNIKLLSVFIP